MNKLIFLAITFFVFCITGFAQQETPPAYVLIEEVVVSSTDPRFAPLFYSTSETGEGSLVYDLLELVKTKKWKLVKTSSANGSMIGVLLNINWEKEEKASIHSTGLLKGIHLAAMKKLFLTL